VDKYKIILSNYVYINKCKKTGPFKVGQILLNLPSLIRVPLFYVATLFCQSCPRFMHPVKHCNKSLADFLVGICVQIGQGYTYRPLA